MSGKSLILTDTRTRLVQLVLDSLPSPTSKRAYSDALGRFLAWFQESGPSGFNRATVMEYRASLMESKLSSATVNLHLSAIRKLAQEGLDNGLVPANIASGISRIKGVKREGVRTGNWLTVAQAEELLAQPDPATMAGKRDRAILAVLIGCGIRRQECARLTLEHVQQREARWVIVDLVGKGNRIRTIPMPAWTKTAIDIWTSAAGITAGPIFRPVSKGGKISPQSTISPQSIFEMVKKRTASAGFALSPHDLRRSFAKLAHKGHAALEQIQLSLGHASIVTTERYLGVRQDLTDAPCDHLGLAVETESQTP